MLVRSLTMKNRKRLAHNVPDTFGTHTGFVYDVTVTDCWAQNGSTHGRVFATFRLRFSANRTRNREEHCSLLKNPFLLIVIYLTHNPCLVRCPFNSLHVENFS